MASEDKKPKKAKTTDRKLVYEHLFQISNHRSKPIRQEENYYEK